MQTTSSQPLPVLVVAPFGRDADLIAETLHRASIPCELCPDPRIAFPRLSNATGALLVEEEALNEELIQEFAAALQSQPAWSDAPVVVLTKGRSGNSRSSRFMAQMRQPLGHTTLLERPIRPETLISTVETVLRARRRQFQIRDVLERLQASEARYRSLTVASSSIVWTADLHGEFVDRLPSWEAYTGQTFEQYRGLGWTEAIHSADRKHIVPAFSAAIKSLRPFQLEFRLRRYDGNYRYVLARGVPVFREDSSVKEWVGTCTDMQDRKDSEVALRKSERLALAGQLAAGIAHEINNPLEAVTNLIYLINTRAADEQTRQFCAMAQHELNRITEISGQTLRFYRKSTKPIETDVAGLLQSLLQLFYPKFGRRNLQIGTNLRKAPKINAFPNELRQLFANLISNAIDATPPGGEIHIDCGPGFDWRKVARGVRVIVADTGSGIPETIKQHIFEPFVTTKGDAGTGLGLWVCDDIVRRHSGRLRLKTRTVGQTGTVFSIFLPAGVAPVPQLSELPSNHESDTAA
ncbi:MAG: ATP-binding protein [Candidatus Korobacteraceae bacterium]